MIRITRNDDIAFNVNEVRGKGDRYKITFYTVNSAVNIQKTDQDVTDGIITLNGSELMTIGEGVMNFRVDNIAPNAGYNDGVFNSSFTRTTKYYIVSGVIIPDGEDTETVIDLISELQNSVSSEITRSTNKDNAHDAALANVYTIAEVDEMLDDLDVVLPDNIVTDANYTHTDNNYTTTEKNKLAGIANGAEVNVQSDWNITNTSSDAFIKNKPTEVSAFTNDAGYLTSYTETDPTVPAWAKQSTKPTYTASEVGALPSSTVIPSKTSDLTNDNGFVTGSKIYVGECTTAAATMPKVCTVETFPTDNQGKPLVGTTIAVKFSNTNTGSTNRGLDVNGTGSAPVWYNTGVTTTNNYYGYASRYIQYFWDGTNWVFLSWGYDANTTYTNVALGQGYAVQSNATASATITATLSSYALTTGGIVSVKFKYDVPAGATLNINSKGAKAIYNKDAAITAGVIKAGDTATFIYNTYYRLISVDRWQDNAGKTILCIYDNNDHTCNFKDANGTLLTTAQSNAILFNDDLNVVIRDGVVGGDYHSEYIKTFFEDDGEYYYWYFMNTYTYKTLMLTNGYAFDDEKDYYGIEYQSITDPRKMGFGYANQSNSSTSAITASLYGYAPNEGGIVTVKFTKDVAQAATLNINSTGAKYMYYKGSFIPKGVISANDIATFMHSGSYYHLISVTKNNSSDYAEASWTGQDNKLVAFCQGYKTFKINDYAYNYNYDTIWFRVSQNPSIATEPVTTIIVNADSTPNIDWSSLNIEIVSQVTGTSVYPTIKWLNDDPTEQDGIFNHLGHGVNYIVIKIYEGEYASYKAW